MAQNVQHPHHHFITPLEKEEILALRRRGKTLQEISDEYNVTRERIRQILLEIAPGFKPITTTHYKRVFQGLATLAKKMDRLDPDYFPHGTMRGYQRGCSCDKCRGANRKRSYQTKGYTPKRERPELWGPRERKKERG